MGGHVLTKPQRRALHLDPPEYLMKFTFQFIYLRYALRSERTVQKSLSWMVASECPLSTDDTVSILTCDNATYFCSLTGGLVISIASRKGSTYTSISCTWYICGQWWRTLGEIIIFTFSRSSSCRSGSKLIVEGTGSSSAKAGQEPGRIVPACLPTLAGLFR